MKCWGMRYWYPEKDLIIIGEVFTDDKMGTQ